MSKGLALLVGLKRIDPKSHNNWSGENGCWGCELDVDNVERILQNQGFQTKVLKTENATHNNILNALRSAAISLKSGDIFAFYYSGHGGQQPDLASSNIDEMDGEDETLVAFDRDIIDDDLHEIWLSFKDGVRIVMISDSCNSGTNYKNVGDFSNPTPIIPIIDKDIQEGMKAQLIHYGGSLDGKESKGYRGGGAFTMALCNVWSDGDFEGNYKELFQSTENLVSRLQRPQYNEYGNVSERFRNSKPFQI